MKETLNQIFLTGVLVSKNFEEVDTDVKNTEGQVVGKDKALRGSVVIRTKDGSENEVKYYATRITKQGKESSLFKGLQTVMNEYKTLEFFPNEADVVKIGSGKIDVRDYKSTKDQLIKSYNEVKANFINRIETKDLELNPQESKFEFEGIIESITDEIVKDVPTGNAIINLMIVGYDSTLIPVKLTVMQPMVQPFKSAGFYEGGYAKLVGKIVNTREEIEIVEKMSFGEDNVRKSVTTVKRYEVTSGSPLGSPIEKGITEDEWNQAKAKRKLKLDTLKNQQPATPNTNSNPFGGNPPANPFNGGNPFAAK